LERPDLGVFIDERASEELAEKLRISRSKAASFVKEKDDVCATSSITAVTLRRTMGVTVHRAPRGETAT
jgi:plasmid maintenance system antidote protein VapI